MRLYTYSCLLPPFHPRSAVLFWSAALWFDLTFFFTPHHLTQFLNIFLYITSSSRPPLLQREIVCGKCISVAQARLENMGPAHKFRSSAIVLRLENMGLFYKRDLCWKHGSLLQKRPMSCSDHTIHVSRSFRTVSKFEMCRSPLTRGIRLRMPDPILSNSFPGR